MNPLGMSTSEKIRVASPYTFVILGRHLFEVRFTNRCFPQPDMQLLDDDHRFGHVHPEFRSP